MGYDDLPGRFFSEAYGIWLASRPAGTMLYSQTLLDGKPHLTVFPSREHPPTEPHSWCFECGRVGEHSNAECQSYIDEDRVSLVHHT